MAEPTSDQPAEARGQAPATQCSVRHDGAQVIAQFSSEDGHKNRRLSFDLVTTGGPPESRTSAVTVSLKNRLVFRLD